METHSLDSFLSLSFPHTDIIAEGILPERSKMVIGGAPKVGKTIFVTQMMLDIATGNPFLGLYNVDAPSRVMVVQQEIADKKYQERLTKVWQSYKGVDPSNIQICCSDDDIRLDTNYGRELLAAEIKATRPRVLVLDPLYKLHLRDEDNSVEMQSLFNTLDGFIGSFGISVVLVHHLRKPFFGKNGKAAPQTMMDLRGSSQISAWADSILVMEPRGISMRILSLWLRHADDEMLPVVLNLNRNKIMFDAQIQGEPTGPIEKMILEVLRKSGPVAYPDLLSSITSARGCTRRQFERALAGIRSKGLSVVIGKGSQTRVICPVEDTNARWYQLDW